MELNGFLVMLLGMGTVFVGLIILILLIMLMGAIMRKAVKEPAPAAPKAAAAPAAAQQGIQNRQEFVAAVSAAIAEDMGTEADGLRIKSIKKL